MARCAAVVLAGGRSTRMGRSKAELAWHGLPFVARVAGVLERSVGGPVVVVRARRQRLQLPGERVEVVADAREGRGPLEGLGAGLRAVGDRAETVFVSSTDAPMLHPAFVAAMLAALDGHDVAVPESDGHLHPLAAAYRTSVLAEVDELLARDRLRPAFLFESASTRVVAADELRASPALRAVDPDLLSLRNVNTPDEYGEALRIPVPAIRIECFGGVQPGPARELSVRATTLGLAADAVGVALGQHVVAALNGDQIARRRDVPLVAGDVVSFMSADAGG
ncbi:MAG: molybdenum cofactor guanylyltransferase [Gaiellales bacterium]